jgi:hypothetical protein
MDEDQLEAWKRKVRRIDSSVHRLRTESEENQKTRKRREPVARPQPKLGRPRAVGAS